MPFFIFISILALGATLFIVYKIAISERKLFTIGIVALLSGVLFESYRVSRDWKIVFYKFIASYILSFFAFLPGKREYVYNFEEHIKFWFYWIVIIYVFISTVFFGDKIIQKLTEGITLILSLSLFYWVIDYGFLNIDLVIIKILLAIGLLFAIFSIFHSITYLTLTRTIRLILSIWSSIVIFAFALDNIIRVFTNKNIEDSEYFSEGLYIWLQYFLLGISAIYIMQNFFLLTDLLPNRNGNYKKDLIQAKKVHIKRYSDKQVSRKDSLVCFLYCFSFYYLNSVYDILPRHTMIWLVIFTFPFFVNFLKYISIKNLFEKPISQ